MIPPKEECCPNCEKELDQAEYDMQYCGTCSTSPFAGFDNAPKEDTEKPTYHEALDYACDIIQEHVIEPADPEAPATLYLKAVQAKLRQLHKRKTI